MRLSYKTLFVVFIALFSLNLQADTYTATLSGDWTTGATWVGGTAPPDTLTNGDQVIIPLSVDVNLVSDIAVNDAGSSIEVIGTLSSSSGHGLTVINGSLTGTGIIDVEHLEFQTNSTLLFTGTMDADDLILSSKQLGLSLITRVYDTLVIRNSDLTIQATGILNLDNDVVVMIENGSLLNSGGGLNLTGEADLIYTGSSNMAAAELDLSTISSVMIDMDNASDEVTLDGDMHVRDMLTIQTGTLNTSNNELTIDGDFWSSANGSLAFDNQGDLTISSDASLSSSIWFNGGTDTLDDLTINIAGNGQAQIESDVHVMGEFCLAAGTLAMHDQSLALYGDFQGFAQGHIATTDQSNLWLMTSGNVSGTLNFSDTANSVNDLMVDMNNDSIEIGSDVMIQGTLTLNSGNVANGDFNIMLAGTATMQGGSPDSYIQTSGNGWLTIAMNASDSKMYHMGTAEAYAGAMIELNGGSSDGNYSARVMNDVYAQATGGSNITASEPSVDKTWFVETDASGNVDLNLSLTWEGSSEVNGFDNTNAYISHYASGQWDAVASGSATANANGTFTLTRNNVTSLSPFAVFDENTSVGIDDPAQIYDLTIYPNPAHKELRVDMPVQKSLEAAVIGTQGRVLYEFDLQSGSNVIDISDLEDGSYFLKVEGSESMYGFVKH